MYKKLPLPNEVVVFYWKIEVCTLHIPSVFSISNFCFKRIAEINFCKTCRNIVLYNESFVMIDMLRKYEIGRGK